MDKMSRAVRYLYLLDLQDAMSRELQSTPNLDYLKYLNRDQLLDLLEDDETIRATVRVNSKLKALQRYKAVLLSSSFWLAKQNLVYKPYLTKTKILLAEKHQELGQLVSSIQHKERKLETLQQKFNLQLIHRLFKEKINHSVWESKYIWHTFTEGKLLPEDFVELIQNAQKLYHKRLVQAEKIQDLIAKITIYKRDVFPYIGHHSNLQHTPTTINVFPGISPVILLPDLQSSHLAPLRHHGFVDSFLISNKDYCRCTENHRWPQRHCFLKPLEKIHKPKTPE